MTFNDYIIRLYGGEKSIDDRWGQWAFNLLHEMHPLVANKIRATDNDPFYQDEKLGAFLSDVAELWQPAESLSPELVKRFQEEQGKLKELEFKEEE